jgi:porin
MRSFRKMLQLARGAFPLGLVFLMATGTSTLGQNAPVAPAAPPAPDLFSQDRSNLLGDMAGLRPALAKLGITLTITETDEVLGNATGGVRRGAEYDGLTTMDLSLDTAKAFGWDGGTFNISALQIHGRDLSDNNLQVLQTASSIEADDATRLWELWYQQTFWGGTADVKIGQQSLDQEFLISQFSSLFINSMMGWPALPSIDMYAGGPAYPLSSLGVRLRGHPSDTITVLGGVFDDNPPGGPFNNDSQVRGAEAAGARFNLGTGALFIVELQYAANQPPADAKAPTPTGLPGIYKIGAWLDTGSFPDQLLDNEGVSLASPLSTGIPQMHRPNFSLYAVIDQMVWRPDPKGPESLGAFLRVMGAPPNMNLVTLSADFGLNLKAPLPGRDSDSFGIGYGVVKISNHASELDRDTAFLTDDPAFPIRSAEQFVEVTYQIQAAGWWQIQPDFQYFINPGGGIPNPNAPGQRIKNEAVLGLRSVITF